MQVFAVFVSSLLSDGIQRIIINPSMKGDFWKEETGEEHGGGAKQPRSDWVSVLEGKGGYGKQHMLKPTQSEMKMRKKKKKRLQETTQPKAEFEFYQIDIRELQPLTFKQTITFKKKFKARSQYIISARCLIAT